jgi:polar amino acid transport system ATP-binding protein
MIGLSRRDAQERAVDLLGSVGMEAHAESYPDDLCGGQQQRVAIVRTLPVQPRVMLPDETTAVLHPELVGEVLEMVRELAHGGPTMPLATHAMGFARDVATHVCFLDNGSVLERGSAEQILWSRGRSAPSSS